MLKNRNVRRVIPDGNMEEDITGEDRPVGDHLLTASAVERVPIWCLVRSWTLKDVHRWPVLSLLRFSSLREWRVGRLQHDMSRSCCCTSLSSPAGSGPAPAQVPSPEGRIRKQVRNR